MKLTGMEYYDRDGLTLKDWRGNDVETPILGLMDDETRVISLREDSYIVSDRDWEVLEFIKVAKKQFPNDTEIQLVSEDELDRAIENATGHQAVWDVLERCLVSAWDNHQSRDIIADVIAQSQIDNFDDPDGDEDEWVR